MSHRLARVIIFTHNLAAMRDFYRDVVGLEVVEEDGGWVDLNAGGSNVALHAAGPHVKIGPDFEGPHKLAFHAPDVAAARAEWVARGARMGPVKRFGALHLSDGDDPDGNKVQLSNRA